MEITAESATGYTIVAVSKAVSGGVNHTYEITYDQGTAAVHDCGVRSKGGCPADGRW